ncbi:hypothetical protein F5Y16DRAFT_367527 [Xylariaceae sp. FL0255]|nr:hypothetical protein F5Y16DRAFT_367527 [Xylariaceae sp. FL0255]
MNCDICQRAHHPKHIPFLCAVDARNELYDGRIGNIKALIDSEKLEKQLNEYLAQSDVNAASSSRPSRAYLENCASEEQKAKDRTERIIAHADRLRDEVAAAKKDIEERKAAMTKRKSAISSASHGQSTRRTREIEETAKSAKMTKYTWDREYEAMTQYKAALCMEVAKLYRLQRVRRGNPARFEYKIGGIEIVDLNNMNNVQPEHLSASFNHITHLLFLASHYLAVRLPAEITLPHNDYPRPTIFSLSSSYQHGEVSFPGSSPIPPDPRDRQFANVPFPRPLFLDKPLTTIAKEDPITYNAFLEGACLLAYNIVWLCKTQGVPVGDNSSHFDAFAGIGRNLYNLLINSSLQRNPQQLADGQHTTPSHPNDELGKAGPRMGLYSHGASHTSLASAPGNELTRSFKLPNPIKLTDKLKSKLASHSENGGSAINTVEWELLEDDAWTMPDAEDDGVLVGGVRPKPKIGAEGTSTARFGYDSFMSVATAKSGSRGTSHNNSPLATPVRERGSGRERGGGSDAVNKEKERSSNGWTKIKPR